MIGGNVIALLQTKTVNKNNVGEGKEEWITKDEIKGFLDYMSGEADYANYNAKIQESTHVFICDYRPLNYEEGQIRLVINNKPYELTLLDDPMGLHKHLEFYLKYLGD